MKDNTRLRDELLTAVSSSPSPFIGDRVRLGVIICVAFFGTLIGWSYFAPLSTGAVASGHVIVEGETVNLQHFEGGIVADVLKKDGDKVEAGDLIILLQDIKADADQKTAAMQMLILEARRQRLAAERDKLETLEFKGFDFLFTDIGATGNSEPTMILERSAINEVLDAERRYFASRNRIFEREDRVFSSQIASARNILANGGERLKRVQVQLDLISGEVEDIEGLYKQGHATQSRVLALKRQKEQYESDSFLIQSQISDASVQLGTASLEQDRFRADRENQIDLELQDLDIQLADARGQLAIAKDKINRTRITAPRAGTIMNSQIKRRGDVVSAGSTLAELVPENTRLIISGQLNPADSSSISAGLPARVTILAFNSRTAPTLDGRVIFVSPDVVLDETTGQSWYPVHVEIDEASLSALGGNRLQPGLPAQVVIKTASRPIIGYLLDPITQSIRGAFHEE